MTKAELEKKHLAELHTLAAEAGVERYRMLPRAELIAKLADGGSGNGSSASSAPAPSRGGGGDSEPRERPARRRRSRARKPAGEGGEQESGADRDAGSDRQGGDRPRSGRRERGRGGDREPRPRSDRQLEDAGDQAPEPASPEPTSVSRPAADAAPETSSRPRRRRRRRFGRRGKQGVTLQGLLLPPSNRQALLAAETREACTAMLRGIAADLSDESNGPDPVALLIDPTPEELADWRRDAPKAEIVAAGQPRHADDALAQAVTRATNGDDVILLVDSLTRLGEAYDDPDAANDFFDAGRKVTGTGTLTVVAALERPA